MPLPHTSSERQLCEQPSPMMSLPSSHTSPTAVSTILLPQVSSDKQSAEQPSPDRVLPSSHTSPLARSTMWLPQVSSDRQSCEQPSPSLVLPSSHASPGSRCALPQVLVSGKQMRWAAAQCMPAGQKMPVAPHSCAAGDAQPKAATAITASAANPSDRVERTIQTGFAMSFS